MTDPNNPSEPIYDLTISLEQTINCQGANPAETSIYIYDSELVREQSFDGQHYETTIGRITINGDGTLYTIDDEPREEYISVGMQLAKEILVLNGLKSALVQYDTGEEIRSYTVTNE